MIALTSSLLASLFLPTGCSMPGWSFCVRMPADARMEVAQDQTDPVIYRFEMADGSNAFVAVGESTEVVYGGQWSERRQGLETVRWQANGDGRIDYYIERVWAESAGIPRFLHAWVEASETGEISGAEELILTLRSCDPRMCPPLGPVASPVVAEDSEEIERDETPMEALQTEPIAEIAPAEPEVSAPAEAIADSDATVPADTAPSAEPVRPVTEAEIQRSGMETIVEVYRAPLPSETETVPPEAGPETDTETGAADAESAPVIDPDPAVESEDAEAETPPRRRSGPVMLTDGN
ncbi:hypothetical protein [Hyphobacterium sp.]|uniref:hypothetical protein n=1 Tax=Hyphobacterium sp. TaxID=2004662 RepID=UPI00374919FE